MATSPTSTAPTSRLDTGHLIGGRRWLARALQVDADDSTYAMSVLHLCGVDRDVERALLRSIAHHHPVGATTTLRCPPADPLLFELRTFMRPARGSQQFMTRLVDVPAAIAAHGWPPLRASVSLEIVDARRPANAGRYLPEVDDGEAALSPRDAGAAEVTVDVGALAALYTGFATATGLAARGG